MNRWLERESKEWQDEKIISPNQRAAILAKYVEKKSDGWQQQVLSLLAGGAIGASIIALWALLVFEANIDQLERGWGGTSYFLAFGLPLAAAGVFVQRKEWARPALLAGLLPLMVATVMPESDWFPWVMLALFVGAFAALWKTSIRAVLAVAAVLVTMGIAAASSMDEDPGITVWFLMSLAAFSGIWLSPKQEWAGMSRVLSSLAVIASWFAFVIAVLEPDMDGGMSLTFSGGILLFVGLAIWQKASGPTLTFGLALTAGLVTFAFESGGVVAGVIALILLSAGFLALSLRKR